MSGVDAQQDAVGSDSAAPCTAVEGGRSCGGGVSDKVGHDACSDVDHGAHAPPGAGEAAARRGPDTFRRSPSPQSKVPEGGGFQKGRGGRLETETQVSPANPGVLAASSMNQVPIGQEVDGVYRSGVLLHVTKKDGRTQPLKVFKLEARIARLMKMGGINADFVNTDLIIQKVVAGSYNNVKTSELDSLMSETAAYLATDHPDYSHLAARVAVSALHRTTLSSFSETVELLAGYVHKETDTACGKVHEDLARIARENAEVLNSAIRYERDYAFDYFGYKTLEKAYLIRVDGKIIERPQHLFMRVALGIHRDDISAAIETYELMSNKMFTHATPTLFNSGTYHNQLASCFLLQIQEDSVSGIYKTLQQCAEISSEAGGIGMAVHKVRARGSYIHSKSGSANGLVPMLRVFNATARLCDQGGGKRPGAFAIYLEPWHAEIFEFLELKKNSGSEEFRARDLFYALWIPDLFMTRCKEDGVWSLFCPMEAPGLPDCYGKEFEELYEHYEQAGKARRTIKARELWFAILEAQVENGIPYMLYKDAANRKSNQKNLGVIQCSNLCTEIMEYTAPDEVAVCNLASICLPRFVSHDLDLAAPNADMVDANKAFDHHGLCQVTRVITKNLNKVIDINRYPVAQAKRSNLRHRPIGIGVQGLADVFMKLRLPFECVEARQLNKDIFETIYFGALSSSCELAKQHGPYDSFAGSPASQGILQFDMWGVTPSDRWDWAGLKADIVRYGLRNSLTVAPMPTASTAQIMGNNECFEPYTSNLYNRRVIAGDFPVINPHLIQDLIAQDLWSQEMKHKIMAHDGSIQGISEIPARTRLLYKTAWEIKQRVLIDMAADRGAFIDQSQSLNLFVESPDTARLTSMHFYAWESGLKTGVYYLRSRAAVDAIKFTVDHAAVLQARSSQMDKRNSSLSASSSTGALSSSSASSLPEPGAGPAGDDSKSAFDVQAFRLMKQRARAAAADGSQGCLMCSS